MTTKALIYKIVSDLTDKIYIGSTTKTLEERFNQHRIKSQTRLRYNTNVGTSSVEIFKYGDARIELLEEVYITTKEELHKREGEYIIRHQDIVVNTVVPGHGQYKQSKQNEIENLKEILEKRYEFTLTEDTWVSSRDIITYLMEQGVKMSDTKIGLELSKLGLKKKSKKVDKKATVVYFGLKV